MSDARYFVQFETDPTRCVAYGITGAVAPDVSGCHGRDLRTEWLSREQLDQLMAAEEQSKWIAEHFNLPYQKYIRSKPSLNIVEMVSEDSSFNQPCRFGNLVEDHAVYCHNDAWVDSPTKCRRTWYTGGKVRDEDCPGFEPNAVPVEGRS